MSLMMNHIQSHIHRRRKRPNRLHELRDFGKNQSGQALTEFCIILPLLLFLIFGNIQVMLIANAQSFMNLANFYALRTGIVHYERYQYSLQESSDENNLQSKMRQGALDALAPVLPRYWYDSFDLSAMAMAIWARTTIHFNIETIPDVSSSISANDRTNWLQCRVKHFDYCCYVPFAGGIIASLHWWSVTLPAAINNDWAKEIMGRNEFSGIAIRPFIGLPNDPMWPYIRMQTKNYNFQSSRSPSNDTDLLNYHRMAIARRIYRTSGTPQPRQ
ncbi:hypothetical protein JXA32_08395 [Candidatus Sumerlaeota bacterium]|nr:hypothetical protein [Candidatus Sumerlaeota bacterium]